MIYSRHCEIEATYCRYMVLFKANLRENSCRTNESVFCIKSLVLFNMLICMPNIFVFESTVNKISFAGNLFHVNVRLVAATNFCDQAVYTKINLI